MSPRDRSKSPIPSAHLDEVNIVNVVIAKNFNLTDEDIQSQMLQVKLTVVVGGETGILTSNTVDADPEIGHRDR